MINKTNSIKIFLSNSTRTDLAELYNHDMECQVNVAQGEGEPVEGEYRGRKWRAFTDNLTTWKSFRIPYNASTEPEYTDAPIKYDLAKHAEGIGMTGWDWKSQCSRWIAFDFDSIVGGHEQSGLSNEELESVEKAARKIPWVTVRKSTSGNGIHLYVFLEPTISTKNHNEHSALARCILGIMAAITGFDFSNKADICGGNMWVWHRKMKGTNGLVLLKKGAAFDRVPDSWKDHIQVVTGRRRKTIPQKIEDQKEISETDKMFMELTGQYVKESLDVEHKKLIDFFQERQCYWHWDQDSNMLITHTIHLKEAHEALNLKGIFNTISKGTEWGQDHNCFLYPLRRGAWVVRRFHVGVSEHESWSQDESGWTRCYYNTDPDLKTASRNQLGVEHPTGGYHFNTAEEAAKVVEQLGGDLKLSNFVLFRKTRIKEHKDGKRIIVEISKEVDDPPEKMKGWIPEKSTWKRIVDVQSSKPIESDTGSYDDVIRHVITEQDQDCGWVIKSDTQWTEEPITHVKMALRTFFLKDTEIQIILGGQIFRKWTLVNKPFQP